MINFPDSPTVGQVFSAVGASWQWTGAKWESVSPVVGIVNDVGRNLIHNSLFNIWQRGQTNFSIPNTSAAVFTADRWIGQLNGAGSSYTIGPIGLTDADRASIGDESATFATNHAYTAGTDTVNGLVLFSQSIEKVRRTAGKTITVSFYADSSTASLKIGVSLDQYFGSGGSPSAPIYMPGQLVTLSATPAVWTRFVLVFNMPSMAGKVLGTNSDDITNLHFWLSSGSAFATRSGGTPMQSSGVNIWGVQLEIGTVATPLEKPDPQQDLAKCQRFYQLVNVTVRTLVTQGWYYDFPVTFPAMRVTPTAAVVTAGTLVNVTSQNMYPANNISVRYEINSTASGDTAVYNSSWSLSADL